MASQFGSAFLGLLGGAAKNPNLQHALAGILRGVTAQALKDKGVSEETRKMLHDLGDGAETLAVAVLSNTPAASQIEPTAAAKAAPVIEQATAVAGTAGSAPHG